jgi:hypothetical protein
MTQEGTLPIVEACAELSKPVNGSFNGEPEKLQDVIQLFSDD